MTERLFRYTRTQAIADSVLVDVSNMAKNAGIEFPVALTWSVWSRLVEVPDEVEGEHDEGDRLWDILTMFRIAASAKAQRSGQGLSFQLLVRDAKTEPLEVVTLKAHCGLGDAPDPVITIMMPDEV